MRGAVRGCADFSGCAFRVKASARKARERRRNFYLRNGRAGGQERLILNGWEFTPNWAANEHRCIRISESEHLMSSSLISLRRESGSGLKAERLHGTDRRGVFGKELVVNRIAANARALDAGQSCEPV